MLNFMFENIRMSETKINVKCKMHKRNQAILNVLVMHLH